MKQILPTEKLNADHLQMIWLKRRCYAFAVTSLAVFTMLVLSWSINVRAFRVDNDMRFRIAAHNDAAVENFKRSLLTAMDDSTSDTYLIQQITRLRDSALLDSPHLAQADLDSIRNRIQVFTKFSPGSEEADVKISFTGKGTPGEQALVNQICEDLLTELRPKNDFTQVNTALADVTEHLRGHVKTQNRFSTSLRSMIDDVDVRLANIDAKLQNVWQNQQLPVVTTLAESKLSTRKQQLERLKAQKDELLLDFDANPDHVSDIDRQIEVVKFEIKQIELDPSPYGFAQNTRFKNVSHFKTLPPDDNLETNSPKNTSGQFQSIDLDGVISSIEMIDSHRRDDLNVPIEFLTKLNSNLPDVTQVTPAASLMKPGVVSVKPIGGKPPGSQMFFLTMLAIAFGSIVAWQINPTDIDRGFADPSDLAATLGVPVLSSFQLQSPREKPKTAPVIIRLVRVCEIIVVAIVAVIVLACLFSQEIRMTMLENPLDGLTRIVGLFRKS